MTAHEHDDDGPSGMMVFIGVSAVFVVVAVIGCILLVVAGSVLPGFGGSTHMPYNLDTRPLPAAAKAVDLLPETLGSYKRGPVNGNIQNFTVTYTSGDNKIVLNGSQGVSLRAAQASVAQIAEAGQGSGSEKSLSGDPTYFMTSGDGPTRLAWSHDRWFFDIQASSKRALDDFMKGFRY